MKSTATIMYIPEEIEDGSEFDRLNYMFPHAACHDGINKAFPLILSDAVNPIIVNDMVDSEGVKLTGDALLFSVAQVLFSADRTRDIHIGYGDLQTLYEHPTYQLYAPTCDTLEELQVIYMSVFQTELIAADLEEGKIKSREAIKIYFNITEE